MNAPQELTTTLVPKVCGTPHQPPQVELGIITYQINPIVQGEHLPGQLTITVGYFMAYQ